MSQAIKVVDSISIVGAILENEDISGISYSNKFIVIGSDEGSRIQMLIRNENKYEVSGTPINLVNGQDPAEIEVDIEAITKDDQGVHYVLGSHSAKRKKVKRDKSYYKNRKRIQQVIQEKTRSTLFRMNFDDLGRPIGDITSTSLETIFSQDKILNMFAEIPSKENGIDLEGIASLNGQLYLGFRGPVLRENFVPILVTTFDDLENYEMRFVNLNGKGVRDIVTVKDGLLIVAGSVSEGDGKFHIYLWDGEDEIPGNDRPINKKTYLGEITLPQEGAKAEGIAIVEETDEYYKAIIIFDGIALEQLSIFKINKT